MFKNAILRNSVGRSLVDIFNLRSKWLRPENGSYSQNGEDLELLRLLSPLQGYFVEIGANHPVKLSNTMLLYCNGFQGVCIEPNPWLCFLHSVIRPRDIQLCCACSSTWSLARISISHFHVLSHLLVGSETKATTEQSGLSIGVATVPLAEILRWTSSRFTSPCAFLSVDTEGHDFECLQSNDWNLFRPHYILAEIDKNQGITVFLESQGYVVHAEFNENILMKEKSL